jgi:solute carrier family 25 phosphate transporter 23/24/25/41|tara:strand:+ start:3361 stop:4503 length:1143 start_codon:yes stop_codon:yes gene_type:complete
MVSREMRETGGAGHETFTAAAAARAASGSPSSSCHVGGAASFFSRSPSFTAHSTSDSTTGTRVLSVCKSLLAGGIAGGVSRTAVAPLERLKILQQVAGSSTKNYNGVWNGLSHIWKSEGIKGMFKGNGANCIRIVPNSASKFLAYEYLEGALLARNRKSDPDAKLGPLTRLCAGAGAGIFAMSATYPLDMLRGRLTVQVEGTGETQYRNMSHAARVIVQEEGVKALYKGWLPSVIGVIPYVGLNFAVYGTLKDAIAVDVYGLQSAKELDVGTGLVCGGIAGAIGQTVAYPFDVCRRKLQVSGWHGVAALADSKASAEQAARIRYTGMVDCFVKVVRHEGVGALFHGLSANYIKVAPSIAIAFVCYEEIKKILGVELYISS